MKKCLALLLLLVCMMTAASCGAPRDWLAFRTQGLRFTGKFDLPGLTALADCVFLADGTAEITLRTPASLEGMVLTRTPQGDSVTLGDTRAELAAAPSFFSLWVLPGAVTVGTVADGERLRVTCRSEDVLYTVTVEQKTGLPVSVTDGTRTLTIIEWLPDAREQADR